MNPFELVQYALGDDTWRKRDPRLGRNEKPRYCEHLTPFESIKIYTVHGATGQFDFPTLPNGSYAVFAANGKVATRLTRDGKEIQAVLRSNWYKLRHCDPVILSRLVLMFYDGGIKARHSVLTDVNVIRSYPAEYVIDELEWANVHGHAGKTSLRLYEETILLRVLTLCGWMHDKRNLGVETITIERNGDVQLEQRIVLSSRMFCSVPSIRY